MSFGASVKALLPKLQCDQMTFSVSHGAAEEAKGW